MSLIKHKLQDSRQKTFRNGCVPLPLMEYYLKCLSTGVPTELTYLGKKTKTFNKFVNVICWPLPDPMALVVHCIGSQYIWLFCVWNCRWGRTRTTVFWSYRFSIVYVIVCVTCTYWQLGLLSDVFGRTRLVVNRYWWHRILAHSSFSLQWSIGPALLPIFRILPTKLLQF